MRSRSHRVGRRCYPRSIASATMSSASTGLPFNMTRNWVVVIQSMYRVVCITSPDDATPQRAPFGVPPAPLRERGVGGGRDSRDVRERRPAPQLAVHVGGMADLRGAPQARRPLAAIGPGGTQRDAGPRRAGARRRPHLHPLGLIYAHDGGDHFSTKSREVIEGRAERPMYLRGSAAAECLTDDTTSVRHRADARPSCSRSQRLVVSEGSSGRQQLAPADGADGGSAEASVVASPLGC